MSTSYNHNRPPHDPENFNYIESVKLAINWHVNDILKARSGHSDVSEERIASSRTSVSSQPHLKTLPYLTRFPSDASMSSSSTRPVSGASFNSDGVDILSQKHDQDREDAAVEIQDDDGEIPLALAYHASLKFSQFIYEDRIKTNMQPEAQWPEKCKGKVPSPIIDTEVIIDLVSPIKPTSTLLPSSSSSFHPSPLTETSHKETSRTAVSERSRSTSPIKPSKLRCFGKRPWHRVSHSSTSDNDECEAVGSLFENRLPDAMLGRRDLIEKRLELSKSRAPFQARNDDAMVDLVSPIKLASATLASSSSSFNPSPLPKSSHKEPSHAFDVQSGRSSSPILRSSSKRPWHGISPSIPSDDDDSEGDAMILDKKWPYAVMGRRHSMEKGRRPVLPAVGTTASVVSLNSMRRDTRSESFEKDVKQSVDKQNLRPHDSPPSLRYSLLYLVFLKLSTVGQIDLRPLRYHLQLRSIQHARAWINRLSLGSSEKPKELSRTSPHRAPTQTRYSMGSSSHCEAPKSVHGIAQWGNEPKKRKHVETESESEDEEGELKCAEPFVWPKKRENRAAQVVNDEGIRAGLSDAQEWGGDDVSIHPSPNLGDEAALTVGKEPDSDVFNQLSHDKERRFAHSRAKDGVEGKHDEEEMGSGKLVNAAHGNGEVFADLSLAGNNLFENDGEKLDPSNFVGLSADVSSSGRIEWEIHIDVFLKVSMLIF
ncbi:hypothetical protein BC829DRAFT_390364 [Chytridium lagenaria]|nr:hypothetical protein BC829DRAFT_390364 [Chytridium lagenaria]